MGKIIVLYGLPASGKTTQADILCKKYGLFQFGMGDVLRAEIASGSELGQKIQDTVASGLLVSDQLIAGVLQNVKKQATDTGIIFDGFPRIISQAELLDNMLSEIGMKVDLFVLLKISPEEAEKRIDARAVNGNRSDDKDPKVINSRMEVFRQESTPLISRYHQRGAFIEVDGEASIEDVCRQIEKYL